MGRLCIYSLTATMKRKPKRSKVNPKVSNHVKAVGPDRLKKANVKNWYEGEADVNEDPLN